MIQIGDEYILRTSQHYKDTNLKNHVIQIVNMYKCKMNCSCHDPGGHGCDDMYVEFIPTGYPKGTEHLHYCIRDFQNSTEKHFFPKPDNVFDVLL